MAFLYLTLFCLVLLFLWRKREHKLGFPGPRGLPFIGCYFSMRGKPMHEALYDWSMQYGGAFTFSIFGQQALVVSNPDTLQEVLVSRGKEYGRRPTSYQMGVYSDNYGNSSLTSNLAQNGIIRKAIHGSIKAYGAGRTKLAAIFDTATADLVDGFDRASGQAIDPKEMLYRVTSMTMCLLLSGQRLDKEIPDLSRIVEEVDLSIVRVLEPSIGNVLLDVLPFLRSLPWLPACRDIKQFIEKRDKLFDCLLGPALEKSKESSELTIGRGLLDIVGQKYGEGNEAGEVTMDNVKLVCMDLIAAGTYTTSMTFYALLNVLQWNTDIQEKIYQEVMREVGDGRNVLLEDRDEMPYSRAVVLEALRYVTVLPLGLPHVTREDTSLSGIPVPKGTQVLTNLWACHHDPRFWPDPWTFKPERFLDKDGQLLLPDHANRKQLFPFGAGIRICVGEILATSRLFLFTTNCVQRFRFLPPDGADPKSCDARNYKGGLAIEPTVFQTKTCPRK